MTADPKRWLEEDDAAGIAAFVGALRADQPSAEIREALWSKIAPAIPGGGGSGGGGGGGSVVGAKVVGLGVAGIAMVTIVAWIAMRPAPVADAPRALPTTPVASSIVAAPVPSETASAIEPVVVEPVASASVARPQARVVSSAPAKPSASATASASAVDRLREEAEGVRRARQHLRDKNPGAALAELDRLAKLVPAGPLAEEREVLTIEATAASGDKEGARRRAERFLFERPNSVHASRVRAFTER